MELAAADDPTLNVNVKSKRKATSRRGPTKAWPDSRRAGRGTAGNL